MVGMTISREDRVTYAKVAGILAVVFAVVASWAYFRFYYTSKGHVFDAMLKTSLQTYGVTRTTKTVQNGSSLEQYSQEQFGAQNVVQVATTITQKNDAGDTKVKTDTIATPTDTYVRYVDIQVPPTTGGKQLDFSKVINEWGHQSRIEGGESIFAEAVYGVVLFGNVTSSQRAELFAFIKDNNVYDIDYSKVEVKNEDGRRTYIYPVTINPKPYAGLLKMYDSMLGLDELKQLDPDQYESAQGIQAKLHVDVMSHTLRRIELSGGTRDETYSGYGIRKTVVVPVESGSQTDLETKLQQILQSE